MNKSNKRTEYCSLILITMFFLILLGKNTQAQGINFEIGDWLSVKKKAKRTNKLIFVDVYAIWCGPCKKMNKNVFTNKDVGDYFNKHFISYKLDAEMGEGIALRKKYEVISYPNLMFVDSNGNLVIRGGSMGVKQLLEFGNKAVFSEKEVAVMSSEYNIGNRSSEFIVKYLSFLKERDLPTEEIVLHYLEELDMEQWVSEDNLMLIKAYIHSPYNNIIEYLAKSRVKFANSTIEFFITDILDSVYNQHLELIINERKGSKEINKLMFHASLGLSSKEVDYLNFIAKRGIAKRDQDWDSYVKHTISYVNTYALDQPASLNNYAWGLYSNDAITDSKALNEALRWVNIALQNNKGYYDALDTKAALLYKLGRREEALIAANNAVKVAGKVGVNPSETLKLIEKIKKVQL